MSDTFERLAEARIKVRKLEEDLKRSDALVRFKANQSYYDGVVGGVITGGVCGVLVAVLVQAVF